MNDISGLEMCPMVAAVAALGEQLGGTRMLLPLNDNAAASARIKASSRIRIILASIESFRECVAQQSATCPVAMVASEANPADNPSWDKPLLRAPNVEGELASLQMALRLRRVVRRETALAPEIL